MNFEIHGTPRTTSPYWKKAKSVVDLYQITITMTPAAKIRFVKNRIEDKVAISPKGPIAFSISDIYAKTFNIFSDEQYSILLKLEEEGYIKYLVPIAKYKVKGKIY